MQSYLDGTPTDGETAKERDWEGGVGRAREMDRWGELHGEESGVRTGDSAGAWGLGAGFLGKRGEVTDWLIQVIMIHNSDKCGEIPQSTKP